MDKYIESPDAGLPFRADYLSQLEKLIESRKREAERVREKRVTPDKMAAEREAFRAEYLAMLGWPLTSPRPDVSPDVWREKSGEDDISVIYRVKVRVFEDFWLYGVLFMPKHLRSGERRPAVISQHGGDGTPELCSGMTGDTYNYNDMTRRVINRGAVVFAPQLLLWRVDDTNNPPYDRRQLDASLKQTGSSVTAVEVYALTRAIDWLETLPEVDPAKIGMIGLSYGGFYTLFASAADTRIRAAVSSCFFNERAKYDWADWTWFGAGEKFFDAELAGLVAPRAIAFEAAERDQLFDPDSAEREYERAKRFFEAAGAPEKLRFTRFEGEHELCKDASDVDFLFANLA